MRDDLAPTLIPAGTAIQDTTRVPTPEQATLAQSPEEAAQARQLSLGAAGGKHITEVPGYEILAELGRGGMGVVYKARDVRLNRLVALKMVLGHARAEPEALIRFLAEAEAAAAVRHPNVVQVYESGEADGHPFMALEYLPGGTLAQRLKALGRLAPPSAAELVRQVALGVAAAHAAGIVHRDLKPSNIMFSGVRGRGSGVSQKTLIDGVSPPTDSDTVTPIVTDFGLAKRGLGGDLTATGAVMGTPAYMAPEQARGDAKAARPAADVWALGAILYECLTGAPPFAGESPLSVLRKVAEEHPEPPRVRAPGVPRDLEAVCLKCLEKAAADRYPTARELADDLGRFLAGEPVRGPRSGVWYRARKTVARRWRAAAGAGLVVGGILTAWLIPSPFDPKERAADPPMAEAPPDAAASGVDICVQVLPAGGTAFADSAGGKPITAVGVSYRPAAGAPPLENVKLILTYWDAGDEQRAIVKHFHGAWPAGEAAPRAIDVAPHPYRRVEVHGTATRAGLTVRLDGIWAADR